MCVCVCVCVLPCCMGPWRPIWKKEIPSYFPINCALKIFVFTCCIGWVPQDCCHLLCIYVSRQTRRRKYFVRLGAMLNAKTDGYSNKYTRQNVIWYFSQCDQRNGVFECVWCNEKTCSWTLWMVSWNKSLLDWFQCCWQSKNATKG